MDEVTRLGHKITRDGVSPDAEKTAAVCQWDTLHDKKEVKKFLGICSWWRKFIPHYAQIAKPLYQLLEKEEFDWNSQVDKAFTTLKQRINYNSSGLDAP